MILFLKGMLIGLSIAAPVGPIGILCIRRTIMQGKLYGFLSGAGAATADALYGCIAAFGLTVIMQYVLDQKLWIQLIGGLFLCYLGVQAARSNPKESLDSNPKGGLFQTYATTFFLTVTNPMTILSFIAVFAGAGFSTENGYFSGALLVLGVFIGSLIWWLLLSLGVGLFRKRLNSVFIGWINKASGTLLLLFGAAAIIMSIRGVE